MSGDDYWKDLPWVKVYRNMPAHELAKLDGMLTKYFSAAEHSVELEERIKDFMKDYWYEMTELQGKAIDPF